VDGLGAEGARTWADPAPALHLGVERPDQGPGQGPEGNLADAEVGVADVALDQDRVGLRGGWPQERSRPEPAPQVLGQQLLRGRSVPAGGQGLPDLKEFPLRLLLRPEPLADRPPPLRGSRRVGVHMESPARGPQPTCTARRPGLPWSRRILTSTARRPRPSASPPPSRPQDPPLGAGPGGGRPTWGNAACDTDLIPEGAGGAPRQPFPAVHAN
jgi:hypothetical protein